MPILFYGGCKKGCFGTPLPVERSSNPFYIRRPTFRSVAGGMITFQLETIMSELQLFNFKSFPIRTVKVNDEVLFVAKDVATALGYADAAQAIKDHCKKSINYTNGDKTVVNEIKELHRTKSLVIPESDVYRLVMRSKLEQAEEFQDWVCEDVLPTIRKTGSYGFPEFLNPITEPIALADFNWRKEVICRAIENLEKAQVETMIIISGKELLAGKCFEK